MRSLEMGKNMVKFGDPDLAFFIYYEDEPAGVCVIFPDINPLLKRLNGRIGLTGLLKFLIYRREINGLRVFDLRDQGEVSTTGTPHAGLPPHV